MKIWKIQYPENSVLKVQYFTTERLRFHINNFLSEFPHDELETLTMKFSIINVIDFEEVEEVEEE